MSDPTPALDAFLDDPSRRDLTRALLDALAKGHGITLACGHGPSAARLVAALARAYPDARARLALVETDPLRLTMEPQSPAPDPIDVERFTAEQVLRSLLRQDMDALAISRAEGIDPQLLLNTAFTGHQLLVGTGAASIDAAIAALCEGSPGLEGHVRASIDMACELDDRGLIRRVLRGDRRGGLAELAPAPVATPSVDVAPAEPAPVRSKRAPPINERPTPTLAPRAAFLPHVTAGTTGRSLLGTRTAHRPPGTGWPACRQCGAPMALVIQLNLTALPPPMQSGEGLAQLFLCTTGACELSGEHARGVLAEVVTDPAAVPVDAPAALAVEVVEPGTITGWRRFDEDPESQDLARLGLTAAGDDDLSDARRPLRSDKLGGWPAWEQAMDWPAADEHGPYELLFQFAEDLVLEGGTPDRWDSATSARVPGTRPQRVIDPERPCHFPSILTAEAIGFLFRQPSTGRLAFRWQTG